MKARHEFKSDDEYNAYLRTYCAALAMQGLLANHEYIGDSNDCAKRVVGFADALIAFLNEPPVEGELK